MPLDLSHILMALVSLTGLAIILSATGFVVAFRQKGGSGVQAFVTFCLPRDLISRRSCYQDVGLIILKQLFRYRGLTECAISCDKRRQLCGGLVP